MAVLHELLHELRDMQLRMGDTAIQAQAERTSRTRMIELRRQFADLVRRISGELDGEALRQTDEELAAEFRRRFSDLRTRTAIFQAKWPAVLLDTRDPEFAASARRLRMDNKAFADWAIGILGPGASFPN